jgi:proline iminopeptidase
MRNFLYPKIQPYAQFYLDVTHPHSLYVEECGNPNGLPVIFIHGGPGAGCSEDDRRFFNPDTYRIILFDQRGCGRSKPSAELDNNTTNYLINDIELIRGHLGVQQWIVFGGSWGSTLSLAYSEYFPDPVLALVLRGIFFGSEEEINSLSNGCGMSRFYPEEYLVYKNFITTDKQDNLHAAYYDIMKNGALPEKYKAANNFVNWDMRGVSLVAPPKINDPESQSDNILAEALVQCHYMVNGCFLETDQIINNISKIAHIPTTIVHGRYDMLCPPQKAFDLHQALPNSELYFTQKAGHASRDEGTGEKLVETMNKLAERLVIQSCGTVPSS